MQQSASSLSVQDRSDIHPLLSGYGVELSVKNTEYKAMDDSKVQGVVMATTVFFLWPACINNVGVVSSSGDESRAVDQAEGDDEVEGFLFNTLRYACTLCTSQFDSWRFAQALVINLGGCFDTSSQDKIS